MNALTPFYNVPRAPQEPRPDTPGPDTTLGEALRQPTPIRPPRPSLRDCVRKRMEDRPTSDEPGRVPADPNRGLFASIEEARRGEVGEIVDLVYRALRADPGVIAWLGARDIDLDTVWSR